MPNNKPRFRLTHLANKFQTKKTQKKKLNLLFTKKYQGVIFVKLKELDYAANGLGALENGTLCFCQFSPVVIAKMIVTKDCLERLFFNQFKRALLFAHIDYS